MFVFFVDKNLIRLFLFAVNYFLRLTPMSLSLSLSLSFFDDEEDDNDNDKEKDNELIPKSFVSSW